MASSSASCPRCRASSPARADVRQRPSCSSTGLAVHPGFELCDGDDRLVEGLCRRLDGLPLAIELAAARMQSLSFREITDALDRSIAVLHGGRRIVDRHRSVAAALEWSHELLDDADREALRAAALFAAPFDPSDLAWILQIDPLAAQERLARLVECSLAHRAGTRFGLLDIVRRFAVGSPRRGRGPGDVGIPPCRTDVVARRRDLCAVANSAGFVPHRRDESARRRLPHGARHRTRTRRRRHIAAVGPRSSRTRPSTR